jgi:hypothetical protein
MSVFGLMIGMGSASAQSLLDIISDEKRLTESVRDIGGLPAKDLDKLADAYAACIPLAPGGKMRPNCREATDRYLIEFDQARAVDVLWAHLVAAIEIDWKFREKDHLRVIDRSYAIGEKVQEAIRAAYRSPRRN